MDIRGHFHHGIVVLERDPGLPEGAEVLVSYSVPKADSSPRKKQSVVFPLVRSTSPGTVDLTNDRIAEILDEENAPA